MKKFIKVLGVIFLVLILIGILIIQKIDRTPYQTRPHYAQFQELLSETNWHPQGNVDSLQVGWSVVSLTPDVPVSMAGYGARWGKKYVAIHDSIYVRSMALEMSPTRSVYLVSADILIIPPNVTDRLRIMLQDHGISLDDVYLGATHSHTSIGGWGEKLMGQLFAGKFDIEIEKFIANRIYQSILQSRQKMLSSSLSYWEIDFPNGVKNRLQVEGAVDADTKIRGLQFVRSDRSMGMMLTFQAHSTLLKRTDLELSRDYSGFLVDSLQAKGIADFAMFFSGSVGSMSSNVQGDGAYGKSMNLADSLVRYTDQAHSTGIELQIGQDSNLSFFSKGIVAPLPEPNARISKNLSLRPWLFKSLFGISPGYIKITRIGNVLLLGMPADFSGEIMLELDAYAKSKGLHLIVTSFNGAYIGYVTKDRWYDYDLYETTTMSWFGYQTSDYLTEVSKSIIDQMAENF